MEISREHAPFLLVNDAIIIIPTGNYSWRGKKKSSALQLFLNLSENVNPRSFLMIFDKFIGPDPK